MAQLAHAVFFTLHDQGDQAIGSLITACQHYLQHQEGVVSFSVGRRAPDLTRPVNDRQFDVALHLVFTDRAAHDRYQRDPRHQEFIEHQQENWAEVRVFDSELA